SAVLEDNTIPAIGLDRPKLDKDLKSVSDKDSVVIDGSPQATSLAISAIKAADFILIPVQPSPYDIWATSDLVDLVQQRIEMMDGQLKAAFVVSRAIQNTNIGKEVATGLLDYNLPVLETRVMQLVAYPNSAAVGKTVFDTESPSSNAIQEITALVSEIQTFFGEEKGMSLSAGRPSKNVKDQLALSDVTDGSKKTVRVNFNLDEDKHIALKRYALESRKTVTELLTEMIEEKLVER